MRQPSYVEVVPESFRVGQRVRTTDTKRRAMVLELNEPFHMAYLRYANGQEGWWAFCSLTDDEGRAA